MSNLRLQDYPGLILPLPAGGGSGTVTSVDMTVPSILAVAGNPVTTAGTFALSLVNQSANKVFSGPSSGAATTPNFRSLVPLDLAAGGSATNFYRGDGVYATPTGTAAGFSSGLDSARPAASTLNIYVTTDTNQQYLSDATKWYVGGKGSDKCTCDTIGGGFSDVNHLVSPIGAACGPPMTNPSSLVFGFYVVSLPGVTGTIMTCYSTSGAPASGWYLGNSAVNSNKLRFTMFLGGAFVVNELSGLAALTTGFHVVALNYNGANVRYCMDGGAVSTVAAAGAYTAPAASAQVFVGRWASTTLSSPWMGFGFMQSYASVLIDADLQAVSNNGANYQPGLISAAPFYDYQVRWTPDGGFGAGGWGFQAYGTGKSKSTTLSAQGTGIAKTDR